jgi:hypothetical protein
MEAVPFLERIAPAMTDPVVRQSWLSDPRSALLAAGIDVPDWADIEVVSGERLGIAVTLGPLVDLGSELTEEYLGGVTGGAATGGPSFSSYGCNCGQ